MKQYAAMNELFQAPTDNLYKFAAIGGLVIIAVVLFCILKEQARLREIWFDAQIELKVGGYIEGSGEPADTQLRKALYTREAALRQCESLFQLFEGVSGCFLLSSVAVSTTGFIAWYFKIQRYDDQILKASAEKILKEVKDLK